jgi:hypothetical protein
MSLDGDKLVLFQSMHDVLPTNSKKVKWCTKIIFYQEIFFIVNCNVSFIFYFFIFFTKCFFDNFFVPQKSDSRIIIETHVMLFDGQI